MDKKVELVSELLREIEVDLGARDLADLVLRSLVDAITSFKPKEFMEFCPQFDRLVNIIVNTEPKFGILNYHFAKLKRDFNSEYCSSLADNKWRRIVLKRIKTILSEFRMQAEKLTKHSEELDVEGKTILIHDHSHTVQDALIHYKNMGRKFKVVIAEQDYDKTHDNIEKMHEAGIEFQVVPSYMLSHIIENIDMLFFGALTLKDTMDFVLNPGAHGIIAALHVEKIPVYMFMNTAKFSLWHSKPRGEIFIHKHKRTHYKKDIEYDRIKYSHDRVPAEMFYRIVTNEGVLTSEEIQKLFEKKLKQYNIANGNVVAKK